MIRDEDKSTNSQYVITMEDFREFVQAESYGEQLRILIAHAQKNKRGIEARKEEQEEKGYIKQKS